MSTTNAPVNLVYANIGVLDCAWTHLRQIWNRGGDLERT